MHWPVQMPLVVYVVMQWHCTGLECLQPGSPACLPVSFLAAARLDAQGAEWAQRCDADKAAWAAERVRLLEEAEARLAEARQFAAAALEEAQQRFRRKLAEAETKSAAAVQATERWGFGWRGWPIIVSEGGGATASRLVVSSAWTVCAKSFSK